jgi:cysteine desulfurase family protein (TIGR01976 family)
VSNQRSSWPQKHAMTPDLVQQCRRQFPGLARQVGQRPAIFFDGPAGTQVPRRVIAAMGDYLAHHNANLGGRFATSVESKGLLDEAHQALADFLGAGDPDTIVFGQNTTSLCFALSRAMAKTWSPGDEVVVTRLDHDANVTPWVMAARDAGATVRYVDISRPDCSLCLDDYRAKLSPRTRLVAIGCASNATGAINPVAEMAAAAHQVGALVFLDAVHFAPHALIDVTALGADFLACSAYKFFGPHVGILWGRRELLESISAYKVRPAPDRLPGKWMSGTQSHESICGALAAVDYLADLGRSVAGDSDLPRRQALERAYEAIADYEQRLAKRLLEGLAAREDIQVWGVADPNQVATRVPTVSITHRNKKAVQLADDLAQQGIFVWHGNYYALELTETLGLEPDGMVRIGLVHYNTPDEIDRLFDALDGAEGT